MLILGSFQCGIRNSEFGIKSKDRTQTPNINLQA
jgi:hypothetical protein